MASEPNDLWSRVRRLGHKMEEEIYDFSEEEEWDEEPRGRNTLMVLLNGFMTLWQIRQATVAERVLGLAGFAGVLWLLIGDRGLGLRSSAMRVASTTFATIWFVPGLIAAAWTVVVNMGVENLKKWRMWGLVLSFAAGGLISFRAVFLDLARQGLRQEPRRDEERPDKAA
jgi:hypothetical protein